MRNGYEKKNKNFIENIINGDWRTLFLKLIFITLFLVVFVRLFNLQITNHEVYALLASDQHEIYKKIFPVRGKIFTKEKNQNEKESFFSLANNKEYALVYAQPNLIDNPEDVARQIHPILFKEEIAENSEQNDLNKKSIQQSDLKIEEKALEVELFDNIYYKYEDRDDYKKLLNKLKKKDDPYEPLKSKVDLEDFEKIKELKIKGINRSKEEWRWYPDANIGSHILGFVRREADNGFGQYGLEEYFNEQLSGVSGSLHAEEGARGGWIAFGNMEFTEAKNGSDIYLTIDRTIQFKACEELKKAFDDFKMNDGSIIVMQPKTGAILAMCSFPDFDPNKYSQVKDIKTFNNPATLNAYEPGSVFKPITIAMAIDLGKVSPNTTYYDDGFVKVDKFTIRNVDSRPRGLQTMTQVLEQSLNTGAIFAAKQVGDEKFLEYVKNFGFGSETGIEQRESSGNIKSLELLNDVYTFTGSFGQGITVTPIQMITAFSSIINNGVLMKPYIVDEIVDYQGKRTKFLPHEVRQVVSSKTANLVKAMLVSVVENGHSKKAKVEGYLLGGKTGTAQIADPSGGYSDTAFNHTFIGFGPMDDPQFTILIKLNNPQDVRFADQTAVPIFQRLAEFILKYYEIPPSR